eukprot:CAMPEP_0185346874 /NCGR_PEP_ID=MMETSP1364-20130426/773_1 /TAXON_ID=38817 /ORGANISM="Gephyrocapsa oceanica, Strain RCC1303" /LENGTH=160 /DNA_ID=CAMNT_0027946201 /DNA_START=505 /DNA_END=983 /DNA_ORIENTATION=-
MTRATFFTAKVDASATAALDLRVHHEVRRPHCRAGVLDALVELRAGLVDVGAVVNYLSHDQSREAERRTHATNDAKVRTSFRVQLHSDLIASAKRAASSSSSWSRAWLTDSLAATLRYTKAPGAPSSVGNVNSLMWTGMNCLERKSPMWLSATRDRDASL